MSYGEVYNRTWFGNALETCQSIIEKPELFGSQFELEDRVETDNAEFEAKQCLSNKITEIGRL